jgi:hypothetical protein
MRAFSTRHRNMIRRRNAHSMGTSARSLIFAVQSRRRRSLSQRRYADDRDAKRAASAARHLHTKLSGVTVIFFSL